MSRDPVALGDVVKRLIERRGYATPAEDAKFAAAWAAAVGEQLGRFTRFNRLKNGRFEVAVSSPAVTQELGFRKAALLAAVKQQLPGVKIRGLWFVTGRV